MRHTSAFLGLLALFGFLACFAPATSLVSAVLAAFSPVSVVFTIVGSSAAASAPHALATFVATVSLSGGFCPSRSPAAAAAAVLFVASLVRPASAEPWNPALCVRPIGVGNYSGGLPFTILGSAGTSVRKLRVYRNNGKEGYLRGIVAFFSDGSEMRGGIRKDQFSELAFSEGEVVTSMTLWPTVSSRVARIDISTNQRSWGYGVDDTAKLSSKAVNVGSGVLVGFQGRAGDDLDQVAPIFLKTLSDSVVENIVFEKVGGNQGLRLVTLREGSAVWNGTDYSWNFAGTESRDTSVTFSSGSSNDLSLKTTFVTSLPKVLESGIEASWSHGTTESHEKHSGSQTSLTWSTTVALSADNPAVSCSALVWEGRLNVRWTGRQTVVADGATVSFPVSGMLARVAYGKVETVCRPLSSSSSSSSAITTTKTARNWSS